MSIPDLLTPPTDNLYKFQAIAGLLLILVSVSYPPWLYHKAIVGYLAAENEKDQLQTQATFEQERRNTVQRRLATMLDHPDVLKKSINDLENKREPSELLLSLQLKTAQIQHQQKVSETEMSMSRQIGLLWLWRSYPGSDSHI